MRYRLTLPEGWHRYGLSNPNAARRFVADWASGFMTGDDPRIVQARHRLLEDARHAFSIARDAGSVDVYAFSDVVAGARLTMMFTVGLAYLGPRFGPRELEVIADEMSTTNEAGFCLDIPAGRALRMRQDEIHDLRPSTSAERASLASAVAEASVALSEIGRTLGELPEQESRTSVTYLIAIPGADELFAVLSGRFVGAEHLEARVNHFDLLMAGFAWEGDE
ncbi:MULTISPECIES: hypothetical protein [Curtobacterium]|uniref:hypothetical protein n=1 Tax=Curtobacterium flaccumfaciens TaxID=2035 RepID=UPI003EE8133B